MTLRAFATLLAATALTTVLMAGATSPAEAMDVSPMISKVTPSGSGSSYRMTVRNDSATPATVEIETYRMQVDANGARSLVEDDKDITVFPVQSVIPANREQVIQVRYTGDATEEGRMYLVRAAQLPINMQTMPGDSGVGADIQVAFTINTYVFVAPPRARAEVQVTAVSRQPNGDVILTAHNSGTGFAYIRESRIILKTADGKMHEVPAAEVDVGEVSVIAGGATRQVKIPAALVASVSGDLTASILLL
ncbi:fimbria/pilus periplasmic chaperone [uncultured Brevundimonas sp.]|uniref:fimbria/pilus periplasmic chaperone n=1 Tax=uncultured Brevundimonas sp. TaxID=213418 RepID=UPI0025EB1FB3|nr:fimbria/pilus periplasmic chaperone [uncultured Brevundimonas sp.]